MGKILNIKWIGAGARSRLVQNIIKTSQFEKSDVNKIFELASHAEDGNFLSAKGKVLATVFYEESTRTKMSFHSAILKLGGDYICADASKSSVKKGESLYDTIKTISKYADIIALRHPEFVHEDLICDVPLINAGGGIEEHPTQALIDLYTISQKKELSGNNILIYGDLNYARTIKSFLEILKLYDNKIKKIDSVQNNLTDRDWRHAISEADIVYITRIQYERRKGKPFVLPKFVFGQKELEVMKKDTMILHPLPRRHEIVSSVDADPRAVYFKQVQNGIYIRMALIQQLLTLF